MGTKGKRAKVSPRKKLAKKKIKKPDRKKKQLALVKKELALMKQEVDVRSPAFWTPKRREIIKKLYAPQATPEQFLMFMQVCQMRNLNPVANQIHCVIRDREDASGEKVMTIQIGIDGFRLISERTGKYRGQTAMEWWDLFKLKVKISQIKELKEAGMIDPGDKVNDDIPKSKKADLKEDEVYLKGWVKVWDKDYTPTAARVGILKEGITEPFWGIAKFDEYAQRVNGRLSGMWENMDSNQIAKCAEAQGHRKANPQELSGIYCDDEMPATNQVMSKQVEDKTLVAYEKEVMKRVQRVHILRTRLELERPAYKKRLKSRYNVLSTKDLTLDQLDGFIKILAAEADDKDLLKANKKKNRKKGKKKGAPREEKSQ